MHAYAHTLISTEFQRCQILLCFVLNFLTFLRGRGCMSWFHCFFIPKRGMLSVRGFFCPVKFPGWEIFPRFSVFFPFFLREKVDNQGESSSIGLGLDGPKLGLKLCSPWGRIHLRVTYKQASHAAEVSVCINTTAVVPGSTYCRTLLRRTQYY